MVWPKSDWDMLWEKTKEGAAQAIAGNCSQEGRRNRKPLWKLNKEKQMAHKNKTNKMEHCTNRVCVQRNLIIELQISKRNICEKNVSRNVVALGVYTAKFKWLALCVARTCKRKLYIEQYKRNDLSRGHYCGQAVSGTAVRSALVYYCIHSSLYTGTVHSVQRCWSM